MTISLIKQFVFFSGTLVHEHCLSLDLAVCSIDFPYNTKQEEWRVPFVAR